MSLKFYPLLILLCHILYSCKEEPPANTNWQLISSSQDTIQDILVSEGVLWAATQNAGLLVSHAPHLSHVYYNKENSAVQSNYFTELELSDEGSVWCATFAHGLFRIKNENWEVVDKGNSPLISNNISDLDYRDGELNIATDMGINWRNDDPLFWSVSPGGISGEPLSEISVYKYEGINRVLYGTNDNGFYMLGTHYTTANSPLADNFIRACYVIDTSNYWVSTYSKLYQITDGWTEYDEFNSGLLSAAVNDITIDKKGNMCFATHEGFTMFDGQEWKTWLDELPHPIVECVFVDSMNNKWLGTFGGIAVYNEDGIRF